MVFTIYSDHNIGNSINYNTLSGKQDEFPATPFYSDGLQYGIMQQPIESGNTEGGVAIGSRIGSFCL